MAELEASPPDPPTPAAGGKAAGTVSLMVSLANCSCCRAMTSCKVAICDECAPIKSLNISLIASNSVGVCKGGAGDGEDSYRVSSCICADGGRGVIGVFEADTLLCNAAAAAAPFCKLLKLGESAGGGR